MKRFILALFFFFFLSEIASSQDTFQPKQLDEPNKGVIYNKEWTVDFKLHTNGFAVGANFGTLKTYYLTRFYHFSLGEIKHEKENRSNLDRSNASGRISRSFIYGKQNNLYLLRSGIGEKRYLSEKARRKGVAIGLSYEGGVTLGLVKPYYLELLSTENNNSPFTSTVSVKYSEEVHDDFLDPWNIFGSSGWTKGFSELSIAPGGHAQAAVHIDWGAFDQYVKAIEAGIMVDFFFKKIPIMVPADGVQNHSLFVNLFVNLQLGKRR